MTLARARPARINSLASASQGQIQRHSVLQRQRVQLAQRLLETSDLSIEAVAQTSGFCTAGNLRKHFSRIMYTSPQAYRRTFQDRTARSA